ncbi:MAG TPA: CRTAC1 family protein [Chthonomonadaceae bacterium]|nr:CRTAC1 family protein [Chthonomonadaceae bacterium]
MQVPYRSGSRATLSFQQRAFLLCLWLRLALAALLALCAAGCHHMASPQPTIPAQHASAGLAGARPLFHDAAATTGVHFVQNNGATGKFYYIEETGGGCAFFDYDNDGYLDILLVQSGPFPRKHDDADPATHCALYHNNGDGTFTDVTAGSGLDRDLGYCQGVAVGDYDNDGYDDLYITGYGGNHLLHNEHGSGKFTDVTAKAGVGDTDQGLRYATSAAFGDYDNDGRLDLYVCHYGRWSPDTNRVCQSVRGEPDYCTPDVLDTDVDRLYHNNGDGTFTDVSKSSGIASEKGHGLGVVWTDYDGDGRPDIFVSNDLTAAFLWHNEGQGKFKDVAVHAGCAYDENGQNMAGMGVAIGDYNNSGRESLFVTNFSGLPNTLFQLQPGGYFQNVSMAANLAMPHMPFLAFGCDFLDYDADGWEDLIVANGHVTMHVEENAPGTTYRERKQLFHNDGDGRFTEITDNLGDLATPTISRGLATGDYDNDGRMDMLVVNQNGPAQLFHNDIENGNHWISFKTVGTKSNRDGYHAKVTVFCGGKRYYSEVHSSSSYASHSDSRVYIGLGRAARVDRVEIHWPSGTKDLLKNVPSDAIYMVTEGRGITGRQPAGNRRLLPHDAR